MVNSPKSKKAQKKVQDLAHHRQQQKDKDEKSKERKKISLPTGYTKRKK